MFSMASALGLDKIGLSIAKNVTDTVLPESLAHMIQDLMSMGLEMEEMRSKLINPITGPLLPFCTSHLSFNLDRIEFCTQVTKDIMLIAAGGTGLATLAETLISSPDQVFGVMTEVFIPVLNDLRDEGKHVFKDNLDKALIALININTDILSGMTLDQFIDYVFTKHEQLKPMAPEIVAEIKQQGPVEYTQPVQGTQAPPQVPLQAPPQVPPQALALAPSLTPVEAASTQRAGRRGSKVCRHLKWKIPKGCYERITKKELVSISRDMGLRVSGTKKQLYDRIIYTLNIIL